jgi:arylsulfatase A-like enzyme
MCDTLRHDFLSCYNSKTDRTPHIDGLAQDGVFFNNAFSAAPWTLPAVASIITGMPPLVHLATHQDSKLPETLKTLAEFMQGARYVTTAIGDQAILGPAGYLKGFAEKNFFSKHLGGSHGLVWAKKLFPKELQSEVTTDGITNIACEWLQKNSDKDFFLWIYYMDPHLPYTPPLRLLPDFLKHSAAGNIVPFSRVAEFRRGTYVPTTFQREEIRQLYKYEVLYVDENIGRLVAKLKDLNLYDDTLIIFTADHGEEFWEHGGFEHGHSLYNEVLHVPLIFKLPSSQQKSRIEALVSTQRLAPTILDICKIDSEGYPFPLDSLSFFWSNPSDSPGTQTIVSSGNFWYDGRICVIFDKSKYILNLVTSKEELYDLSKDPGEEFSLANSYPEKIREAREILLQYQDEAKKLRIDFRIEDDNKRTYRKEMEEALRSLGYIR